MPPHVEDVVKFQAQLLDQISDAVIAIDTEQRVTHWSQGAVQLYGVEVEAALGHPLTEFCEAVWLSSLEAQEEFAYTGRWKGEQMVCRSGERDCYVDVLVRWLDDEHGRLSGWLILCHDVTAHKLAVVNHARLLAEQQEALVAAERAREEAEAAVRQRDKFLSIVTHELKTPLTTLLGHAQLLERQLGGGETIDHRERLAVRTIIEQGQRLNERIMRLLDVSHLETGNFRIAPTQIDLLLLVRRVVEEFRTIRDTHPVVLHHSGEQLAINGDEVRLEQVLQNLLQNARKYSSPGSSITVRVERRGNHGCVVVEDQGIGIPLVARPNLFQIFYRAENTRTMQVGGTGIGLFIAKQIVTLHGGTVDVDSTEGAGSTFTITIPLVEQ